MKWLFKGEAYRLTVYGIKSNRIRIKLIFRNSQYSIRARFHLSFLFPICPLCLLKISDKKLK
ncbi:MAG: hypothetical protein LBJ00_06235 [Planctomycetaceae bacterium]|nr:hypothetical protein [Planctomycetaceae bacterium]